MTQVTIGFQLGGQAFSQIVFFEDKRALSEFTGGNLSSVPRRRRWRLPLPLARRPPQQVPPPAPVAARTMRSP